MYEQGFVKGVFHISMVIAKKEKNRKKALFETLAAKIYKKKF